MAMNICKLCLDNKAKFVGLPMDINYHIKMRHPEARYESMEQAVAEHSLLIPDKFAKECLVEIDEKTGKIKSEERVTLKMIKDFLEGDGPAKLKQTSEEAVKEVEEEESNKKLDSAQAKEKNEG